MNTPESLENFIVSQWHLCLDSSPLCISFNLNASNGESDSLSEWPNRERNKAKLSSPAIFDQKNSKNFEKSCLLNYSTDFETVKIKMAAKEAGIGRRFRSQCIMGVSSAKAKVSDLVFSGPLPVGQLGRFKWHWVNSKPFRKYVPIFKQSVQ